MTPERFSLQYIEILKDVILRPSIDTRHFNERRALQQLSELRRRGQRLFEQHTDDILGSLAETQDKDVTFHYGYSNNILNTLTYAPFYTDHIILQDATIKRAILNPQSIYSWKVVSDHAEEIVRWEPFIEDGSVSIVPSPEFWSQEIYSHFRTTSFEEWVHISPLYATCLLNCTPMTDAGSLDDRIADIPYHSLGEEIAKRSAEIPLSELQATARFESLDPTYLKTKLQKERLVNVEPLLFGEIDGAETSLWKASTASPEEIKRIAADFDGFRTELKEITSEIHRTENVTEITEIAQSHAEAIQRHYEEIDRQREDYRRELNLHLSKTLLTALPVLTGISQQDVLTSYILLAASSGLTLTEARTLLALVNQKNPGNDSMIFRMFQQFE